ncbi:hypothetical protein Hanom_Chr16g01461211 [Helianthus anomalus]
MFLDLFVNVNSVKNGSNAAFLMYPRLLSYYIQKQVSQKKEKNQQGIAFQMKSLTNETSTRMQDKESKVSKTQTKGDESVLDKSTYVAQTSVVEPTTPSDHDTTTGVVKPTQAKPKKKPSTSKKSTKTKQHKKAPLEDEILEDNLVKAQKSLETVVATSSQQLDRSPPNQTSLEYSQKD